MGYLRIQTWSAINAMVRQGVRQSGLSATVGILEAKLTPRQLERRRRILAAVRRQIGERGYASLNMRDVAREAEVANATLYNQFETKDGLVLAALRDNLQQIADSRTAAGQSAIERYFGLLRLVNEQIVASPRYAEAMTELMFNAAPSDEVTDLLVTQRIASDRASVRQMIAEGSLSPDTNVDLVARRLTGAFWSTMLLWMKGFVALHDLSTELTEIHRTVLAPDVTDAGRLSLLPLDQVGH